MNSMKLFRQNTGEFKLYNVHIQDLTERKVNTLLQYKNFLQQPCMKGQVKYIDNLYIYISIGL